MRLQFSLIHLFELIVIVGITISLDQWAIANEKDQDLPTRALVVLWGSAVGLFLAARHFHRLGGPTCGLIALFIAVPMVILNGGILGYLAPGIFLKPSPSNPFPLENVDYSELQRLVLIGSLVAGGIAAVSTLGVVACLNTPDPVGRASPGPAGPSSK